MIDVCDVNHKLYQLVSKIGSGGFSEVFHCVSFETKKNFALKKVKLENLNEEDTNLIMNEVEVLKKLRSTDKVVELFD
jgi:serine/threonine protein kinase